MLGSFFGKLFGTEKALGAVVDGVTNGLDALVYTDEEKAADAAADRSEARKMVVAWMNATQGQNLARRLIALSITTVWLGMYLIGVAASMAAVFVNNTGVVTSVKMVEVATIAKQSAADMNNAIMLILAFYFASPYMGKIADRFMSKTTLSQTEGR